MERLLVVVVLAAVAVGVAALIRARTRSDAPTRPAWAVPDHLDRREFARPEAPWLVAVFSSATCLACRATWDKARALESDSVAVQELEAVADADLHARYGVDAVPLVVVAGPDGTVRASFLGEPPTSELWAAVASARDADGGGAAG
ncbi:MAG TPA: hypothetical protein VEW93_02935 [Acidimicrobiales bacterium]|nr:hypothetical protein [Acidimicrobiales bacterium]